MLDGTKATAHYGYLQDLANLNMPAGKTANQRSGAPRVSKVRLLLLRLCLALQFSSKHMRALLVLAAVVLVRLQA